MQSKIRNKKITDKEQDKLDEKIFKDLINRHSKALTTIKTIPHAKNNRNKKP